VKGGRCENCEGQGQLKIEMQFLADIYVACDICGGRRYNRETLQVHYKGKSIADVLEMTVDEGITFFENIPTIFNKLETLKAVGLGYIRIGQPATTLSGGEAQRIKLSRELAKRATGQTFYILDEPSTGLHAFDVAKLIDVLQQLEELVGIVLDRANTGTRKKIGEGTPHGTAIFQNVGYTGRTTGIVFQHEVSALVVTDEICATNMHIDITRHVNAHDFPSEIFCPENVRRWDDAVFKDFLLMVNILQKQIEGNNPLFEPPFEKVPFRGRNDSRNKIKGHDALGSKVIAVNGEGDSCPHERQVNGLLLTVILVRVERLKALKKNPVMRTGLAVRREHFIKKVFGLIRTEIHRGKLKG